MNAAASDWTRSGSVWVRNTREGGIWTIEDLPGGWRLKRGSEEPLHRQVTAAIAGSLDAAMERAVHYDAHALRLESWMASAIEARKPGPHGTALVASKAIDDITLRVDAMLDGVSVGYREGHFESAAAAYVLDEDVLTGGAFVDDGWIGKGLGRALMDFGDEVSGLRSAPDSRNGTGGTLSDFGEAFWEKRARHVEIPGSRDPEGVARRLAEVERLREIQWAERAGFLDVQVAVALAEAIDGEPVTVVAPDGDAKGWAEAPDGRTLTTRGWDSVSAIEFRRGRLRKGVEYARDRRGLLSSLSISTTANPLVERAVRAALVLYVGEDVPAAELGPSSP